MADLIIHKFVETQRKLLEVELQSEEEEEQSIAKNVFGATTNGKGVSNGLEAEAATHVLRNLDLAETSVGLYGRTVVTLAPAGAGAMTDTDNVAASPLNISARKPNAGRQGPLLPSHRLTVGDEVVILSGRNKTKSPSNSSGATAAGGVICALQDCSISIALFTFRGSSTSGTQTNIGDKSESNNVEDGVLGPPPLSVLPRSSAEVHRKIVRSLDELDSYGVDHPLAGNVIRALFCSPSESLPQEHSTKTQKREGQAADMTVGKNMIEPFNSNLDESQIGAVNFALGSNHPIALIHGPPGTGKTTTVAELVQQAVHCHKMKVLVTAPSNVAVDNVLERLVLPSPSPKVQSTRGRGTRKEKRKEQQQQKRRKISAVRLGHPARIKPSILPYSLESLVRNADGSDIVSDCRDELASFLRVMANPKSRPSDKHVAYREIRCLRKEIREREESVVRALINDAQVVLATNVGAGGSILRKAGAEFDLVVIDEAAQALEASCWIPILMGRKVVLAGDHKQLPPTIKSQNVQVQNVLGRTMFERVMDMYSGQPGGVEGGASRMLRIQYRMHEDIADWASKAMYEGQLESFTGVKGRKLSQLAHVAHRIALPDQKQALPEDETSCSRIAATTLLLVDTTGCEMHEMVNAAGSKCNEGEAQIVKSHILSLLRIGLKPEDIAVITPYNGQVELLRSLLLPTVPKLEIRSVDGFQGGEREAVVLSMVRSSDRGGMAGIGFLKDERRLNVAITRAKRHCAVVCDCETVSQSRFIKGLLSWMENRGDYRSAAEFLEGGEDAIAAKLVVASPELARLTENTKVCTTTNSVSIRSQSGTVSPPALTSSAKMHEDEIETQTISRPLLSGLDGTTPPPAAAAEKGNSVRKHQPQERREETDSNRNALMDKIGNFAESGRQGEELVLSSELTKIDRLVVCELAKQLGLGHRIEEVDGSNSRMIVTVINEQKKESLAKGSDGVEELPMDAPSERSTFPAFSLHHDISSDSEPDVNQKDSSDEENSLSVSTSPSANALLGDLAMERIQRQQQHQLAQTQAKSNGSSKKKKKKPKGKKPGKAAAKKCNNLDMEVDADLDDIAFLNAQIEKVQTSHGRKVEGKGTDYRSIVNGILVAKPKPQEPKKNTQASMALRSKLKNAKDERKVKVGSGKKRK